MKIYILYIYVKYTYKVSTLYVAIVIFLTTYLLFPLNYLLVSTEVAYYIFLQSNQLQECTFFISGNLRHPLSPFIPQTSEKH